MIFYLALVLSMMLLEYGSSWSHISSGVSPRSAQIIDALTESPGFLYDVSLFVAGHLVMQVLLAAACYVIGATFAKEFRRTVSTWVWASVFYISFKIYIYYLNSISFPQSRMAFDLPARAVAMDGAVKTLFYVTLIMVTVVAVKCIAGSRWDGRGARRLAAALGSAVFLGGCLYAVSWSSSVLKVEEGVQAHSSQKNVILIGVDSVSWEHLSKNLSKLPNISQILSDGYAWSSAVTPLARTFPAWNSILTGVYPAEHGAVFNLVPTTSVSKENLAWMFKRKGYRTIYAQDERRFNNIDQSFGFDDVVGPDIGAADFMLPLLSDHPMANLLYGHKLGQGLFPFLALNRVADMTYVPSTFVSAIDQRVGDSNAPLFLATHFCLAHFPYTWATPLAVGMTLEQKHMHALKELDRQVGALMTALRQRGKLNNALVILFSDHGESIAGAENSYFATPELFRGQVNGAHTWIEQKLFSDYTGHGHILNSKSQYNSFVVFSEFPASRLRGTSDTLISLTDVAPTVAKLLFETTIGSGRDLSAYMMGHSELPSVPVFSETGLFLSAIQDPENVDEDALLSMAEDSYEVLDDGRVQLSQSAIKKLMKEKEFGVFLDHWLLMSLVGPTGEIRVIVDLRSGEWTYDLQSDLARSAPVGELESLLAVRKTKTFSSF